MSLPCKHGKHSPSVTGDTPRFGDDWSATLYRTHLAVISARCRRLLHDRSAAEDAAHETFARAFRRLPRASDSIHQRRWLLRVATNYCLNQLRDRKRQAELLLELDVVAEGEPPMESAAGDIAALVARGVPEQVQRVAWLLYVDELHQHQVAEVLGISRRTVVNRLAVFRTRMRRALSAEARLPTT
jgi:RNA polymerase sigma-70 factor (ECF subfamily)